MSMPSADDVAASSAAASAGDSGPPSPPAPRAPAAPAWTRRTRSSRARARLGALLCAVVLAGIVRWTTLHMGRGEAKSFQNVAEHVGVFTGLPNGYRILVPYAAAAVAALTGLSIPNAFLGLAVVGFLIVTTTIISWSHEGLGLSFPDACLLGVLYAFSYAGAYYLHNVQHVGFYEHLVLLLGFMAIYHRRYGWLALLIFVGTFVNERTVLLPPVYFLVAFRELRFRALPRAAFLLALALAAFFLLRSGVFFFKDSETADNAPYASYYTWKYIRDMHNYHNGFIGTITGVVVTFPVLWPLAFLGLLCTPPRERVLCLLGVLAMLQLILAADTLRMVAMAFPAILLLVGNLFRTMRWFERVLVVAFSIAVFYAFNYGRRDLLFDALVLANGAALVYYLFVLRRRLRAKVSTSAPSLIQGGVAG